MLITHKTKNEFIKAYLEFHIVDENGKLDKNNEYLYIADIWVHPRFDGVKEIGKFIKELNEKKVNSNVKYIYWRRTKKDKNFERISQLFSRDTCLRRMANV